MLFIITGSGKRFIALFLIAVFAAAAAASAAIFAQCNNLNPLHGKSIIIDPGHGGIDGGTNDGLSFFEKDINLRIAKKLQTVLESDNAFVNLTRDKDVSLDGGESSGPTRHRRDLLARVTQFNSGKYDLFISIHVNHSSDSRAIGPLVLYSASRQQNLQLADCMQNRLNRHIKSNLDKDIKHNPVEKDFFILINSNIPGIIIETGFISNPVEKELLRDGEYQLKLAETICAGIKDYFKNLSGEGKNKPTDSSPGNIVPEEDSAPFNMTTDIRIVELSR